MFGFTITSFVWVLACITWLSLLYKYLIRPCLILRYYKNQGGVVIFHKRLAANSINYENAFKHGDFFHLYKQAVKTNPTAKFIVENLGDKVLLIPVDSEMVKEVLRNHEVYQRASDLHGLQYDLANGSIILKDGIEWKKRRRILSNAFNFDLVKDMIPTIVRVIQERFDEWMHNNEISNLNILHQAGMITGEIAGYLFFGQRFSQHQVWNLPFTIAAQTISAAIGAEQLTLCTALFGPNFARKNILPRHKKLNNQIREFRTECIKMIKEAENSPAKETNIINLLLNHRRNGNQEDQITDEEIVGESIGFFLGGTETSSLLFTSAIYYLSKHPQILEKLKEEINRELTDLSTLTIDNINRMEYMTVVLKETMRLGSTTGALLFKSAVKDDILNGVKVKKGTLVSIIAPIIHTSEKRFSRPEEFIPERWLSESPFRQDASKTDSFSFLGFSAGPRNCVAQHFAMIEAKILLGMFIKQFEFRVPDDYTLVLEQKIVFALLKPLLVSLTIKNLA